LDACAKIEIEIASPHSPLGKKKVQEMKQRQQSNHTKAIAPYELYAA
jgi:hypothetical protein